MRDTNEIVRRIQEILALGLGIEPEQVQPDATFDALGIDSIIGLTMVSQLEEELQIPIEPTAAYDYPSPRKLAEFLSLPVEA